MQRYRSWTFPVLAFIGVTAACSGPTVGSVDGTWLLDGPRARIAGGALTPEQFQTSPLTLKDGKYTFQNDSGEYVLMPDSVPAAMDIIGRKGPNAGKMIQAIYKMENDTLTICYDLVGAGRPKTFASDSGTALFLAHYARTKPPE